MALCHRLVSPRLSHDGSGSDVDVEWHEQHDGLRHQDPIGSNEKNRLKNSGKVIRHLTFFLLHHQRVLCYVTFFLLLVRTSVR
jgi:hypothetical protein